MENLAPPLELAVHLRFTIEKGESLSVGIKNFLSICSDSHWRQELKDWLRAKELKTPEKTRASSPQRQALLDLVERGLQGEPIYETLCELQEELEELSQQEMEVWVSALPLKALLPLFLFQFPALVVLILGPLLTYVVSN